MTAEHAFNHCYDRPDRVWELIGDSGEAFRRRAAGEDVPADGLTPARLLEFATAGGAADAGLAGRIGSLTPGTQADIVLIDTARGAVAPALDPVGAVTAFSGVADVDTALVAGVVRKRHGRLVGLDPAGARDLVADSRRYLLGR